jgi:3,5-epimerase/4-reductase
MAEQKSEVYLIFGKNGWIGGKLGELLTAKGKTFHFSNNRLENLESIAKELDEVKATHVLNAAGCTGRPNVDWCEDNKQQTTRTNVVGTLGLADLCWQRKIHMTNYATGCIYEYDDAHTIGGKGFTEEDEPNFKASFYSYTKGLVEKLVAPYTNVLTLRLRMPLSDDLHSRNFITKISKYEKVVNVPNSMTILYDLLPVSLTMAERNLTGIYNFTNPGAISHNEILALFKQYINPEFTWNNFSLEEQALILKAGRSNNTLDTTKLENALPDMKIPHIQDSIVELFKRMRVNLGVAATELNN